MEFALFLMLLSIVIIITIKYYHPIEINNARKSIEPHINLNETVIEYAIGRTKEALTLELLAGILGLPAGHLFLIVLTDKRVILAEIQKKKLVGPHDLGSVESIQLSEVQGMEYKRGPAAGILIIHHSAGPLEFRFGTRPWFPKAIEMAKKHPIQNYGGN